MEEKVLMKSQRYSAAKISLLIFVALFVLGYLIFDYLIVGGPLYMCRDGTSFEVYFDFEQALHRSFGEFPASYKCLIWASVVAVFLAFAVWIWISKYEIAITDERVYGRVAFGKHVNFSIDSVFAVEMGAFKRLSFETSSGRISFMLIKNRDEIKKCICDLLTERKQNKTTAAPEINSPASNADELKKYKDLLDDGIISQKEFDAKKKQLLGL